MNASTQELLGWALLGVLFTGIILAVMIIPTQRERLIRECLQRNHPVEECNKILN